MRFASPNFLWFFIILPLMAIYLFLFRENDIPTFRFSDLKLIPGKMQQGHLRQTTLLVGFLRLLAVSCLIIALARPQHGLKSSELTTKATDILVCLDASRSMLSIDFKPKNRFEVAKNVIQDFLKGREYDRIGLVVFGEEAVTQCPLTIDRTALFNLIDTLNIGVVPADQTAIGVGLATTVNRLKSSQAKSKVIILLTDGANNAGTIDPITAAKTAAAFGIKIHTIGAGSPDGGLMPIDDPVYGQRLVKFKSDLDEDLLLRIASETKGQYFRATSPDALKKIFSDIDSLEKTDIKVKEYTDYQELYIGFLLAALGFLIFELALTKTWARSLP